MSIEGVVHSADGPGAHARGTDHAFVAIAFSDGVHGVVQVQYFLRIVEQIDLVIARYQMAEPDAHQTHQQPPVVKGIEKLQDFGDQNVVGTGIRNVQLFGIGVEIGIPDLHHDTGRELFAPPQLIGQIFGHGDQDAA